jgi:hypothetical protein
VIRIRRRLGAPLNAGKCKTKKKQLVIWLTRSASDQIAFDEDIPSETRLFSAENGIAHAEGALNDEVRVDNLEYCERDEYIFKLCKHTE